ncbi:MAG TPA: sulfite exporter TauE/SafE family protein [Bacillota bacterium]|nr:sulfite exporter TauE/SafE family protein [Bacillota bacterium]
MPGLLLGVSIGSTCLAYCAPALFPYLVGSGRGWREGFLATAQFLAGRLLGYLLFAIVAWATNQMLLKNLHYRGLFYGASYIVLAVAMFVFFFQKEAPRCAGEALQNRASYRFWQKVCSFPVGMGFLTGLNLCPPFLLAFAGAAESGSLWGSMLFFAEFFVGTSLYFIPAPFLGSLGRYPAVRETGRLAALIVGVYYIYLGIMTILGGILS